MSDTEVYLFIKILFRKMSLKRDHCEKQTSANLDRHEEINVNALFYS